MRRIGWVLSFSLVLLAGVARAAELEEGFSRPPEGAKPWVYWFVMDGNFNREGITADLEALQRVGIGGVLLMEVDLGIPRGPTKFMSPEWRELFKHANREAARLGMVITMPASPGWTGSGGPWVRPEQSMQKLVFSQVEVAGPRVFDAPLPQPPVVAGFYRDVAVMAFPTPAAPARIDRVDEKALYTRGHFSSEPNVAPLLPMAGRSAEPAAERVVASARIVNLSDKLGEGARLKWEVPEGKWTIVRFGHTSTGANTRPAPQAGLGLECDKLDKAALNAHFDAFLGKLLGDIGPLAGKSLVSLHIDSWEMGPQNWTARFPEEFLKRRGYELLPYLPVMTGQVVDSAEVSERFLWDLRQTVLELIAENHAGHLAELAHKHGMGLSIEPYDGTPCDDLTYGARADVPMGEFWWNGFDTAFSCAEATSIAHTYGRRIVQAEAFTSNGDWSGHPARIKALGDWAYCEGINRFVFHRSAHQPWLDRRPGMTMGPYGIHYERTQTWFEQSRAWVQYLTRCQSLLQRGLSVADICYLMPEASPQVFRQPASAVRGNPPRRLGYNFDACTAEALLTRMSVKDGRLVMPDGMSYRALALPKTARMTPKLLAKIVELAQAGATVIGPRPSKSPSLAGYPRCDAEVTKLAGRLWGTESPQADVEEHACGKGRVFGGRSFGVTEEAAPAGWKSLEQAQWIWHAEGNPAAAAPVGKRYFRRTFTVEAGRRIAGARMAVTADNAFELWINGSFAGSGDDFRRVVELDVAEMLKAGENLIAVEATNASDAPNPAGLIAAMAIRYADGGEIRVVTDGKWESRTSKNRLINEAAGEGWQAAMALGPAGMEPWASASRTTMAQPDVYVDYKLIAGVLEQMGIPADFESDRPLRYTHRRDGQTEIYFVSNGQDEPVSAQCTFRVSGKRPEIWDAVTGERRLAAAFRQEKGRTIVPLEFEPSGSLFVIFRQATDVARSDGRNFPTFKPAPSLELNGAWEVSFDPKWGGPEKVTFDSLCDWTKRPEDGIRHYSGTAVYRKTFTAPATEGKRIYVELGAVEVMAQVFLNGREMGIAWKRPYRVEITQGLKAGENALEVRVVNLWSNRLIGDQGLPEAQRRTWTTWNPYRKDSPLLPSGLIGPVALQMRDD